MIPDNDNGRSSLISVSTGNGEHVINKPLEEGSQIHLHFHLPGDLPVVKNQPPIFNINVNISCADLKPTFHSEFVDFPETVGGDPSTSDMNPPGTPKDPVP